MVDLLYFQHGIMMSPDAKKTSSKAELFWNRFEKSGSIQAYLKFHASRQKEASGAKVKKAPARNKTAAR